MSAFLAIVELPMSGEMNSAFGIETRAVRNEWDKCPPKSTHVMRRGRWRPQLLDILFAGSIAQMQYINVIALSSHIQC